MSPPAALVRAYGHLDELAAAMNAEYALGNRDLQSGAEHMRQVGHFLIQAKAICPHGQWTSWVTRHCTFKLRQAQKYMRLVDPKAHSGALLDLDRVFAILSEPEVHDAPEVPHDPQNSTVLEDPKPFEFEQQWDGQDDESTEAAKAVEPQPPPDEFAEIRSRVVALTRDINALLNAADKTPEQGRLYALCRIAELIRDRPPKEPDGPWTIEFLPLIGFPMLLAFAADTSKTIQPQTFKLKYDAAACHTVPRYIQQKRDEEEQNRKKIEKNFPPKPRS